MTLTSATFVVVPNAADGKQRLSDPTGVYEPVDPGTPLLPVTGLAVSSIAPTSMMLSWSHDEANIDGYAVEIWVTGGPNPDTGWREIALIEKETKTFYSGGLPAETYVRHRVAAGVDSPREVSAWSEVDATTLESPISGGETNLTALTFFYNFEQHSNGYMLENVTPFRRCGNFVCDTSRSYAGTRSARTHCPSGSEGNNVWGYALSHLPRAREGCEVWWRKAVYWPSDANTSTPSIPYLKQMRMMRRGISDPDNDNRGSSEVSLRSGGLVLVGINEGCDPIPGSGGKGIFSFSTSRALARGGWAMMESYCKFSQNENVGIQAAWIDGKSVGRYNTQTMSASGEEVNKYYMGTFWNSGAQGTQYQWYDQIAIAMSGPTSIGVVDDKPHMARDDDGEYFIGMDTYTGAF